MVPRGIATVSAGLVTVAALAPLLALATVHTASQPSPSAVEDPESAIFREDVCHSDSHAPRSIGDDDVQSGAGLTGTWRGEEQASPAYADGYHAIVSSKDPDQLPSFEGGGGRSDHGEASREGNHVQITKLTLRQRRGRALRLIDNATESYVVDGHRQPLDSSHREALLLPAIQGSRLLSKGDFVDSMCSSRGTESECVTIYTPLAASRARGHALHI
ncbi:hypothetical protein BBBOND_0401850 [Babesia bigemina]|uniref:Uncharacterized protein n=1 Tax=Babesia bigemina TaxID=5866 RepID=A0A061DDU3_BABBI|nr:hypothetical protein BBBOND_0401850 [Babesia bigemina]CDR97694.1 hypothetical protein BBBOND_0401850 [Babesia bigemina]|eukprot:XP_012769880.1 hypothetical protein BBBOND_0401850 [Babesia bigemina]